MFLVFCGLASGAVFNATCYYTSSKPSIVKDVVDTANGTAWATFSDVIEENGFHRIVIETNDKYDSKSQMICAGYVDGYLMQHRIWERVQLYKDIMKLERADEFPEMWTTWLNDNMKWTRDQVEQNPNDAYWVDIGLILDQFDGHLQGYNAAAPEAEKLKECDMSVIQGIGDIYDLVHYWTPGKYNELWSMECSGLVRLLPDYSDIYFGQDTWSDFRKMSNVMKEYRFNCQERKAKRVVLSARLGSLESTDDFWVTDAGLMVLETTNSNFNLDLYKKLKKESLLNWVRVLHATYSTDTAESWADEFLRENSGTYNNQYVVVDTKKLVPGKKPEKDLVWITETLPGMGIKKDVTDVLVDKGFWPSFNTPYTEEIYNAAGYPEKIKEAGEKGPYYSYYNGSRYLVFSERAPKVETLEDFKRLMRKNEWKTDPNVRGDPGQDILARYDQRPPGIIWGNASAFGGLDSKAASAMEVLAFMNIQAIGSPEYENNPVWRFGEAPYENLKHDGLPVEWKFPWLNYTTNYDRCGRVKTQEECYEIASCGWCACNAECVLGFTEGPALSYVCPSGWSVKTELPSWATPVIATVSSISVVFVIGIFASHFYVVKKENKETGYDNV